MLPTACFLPSSLPPRSPGSQRATCHTYLFAHRGSQVAHMWADGGQTDSPQVLSLLSEIDTIYSFLFSPKSFLPAGGKCLAQSCTSPARTCHENSGKCSISMIGNPSALWPRRPPVSPPNPCQQCNRPLLTLCEPTRDSYCPLKSCWFSPRLSSACCTVNRQTSSSLEPNTFMTRWAISNQTWKSLYFGL